MGTEGTDGLSVESGEGCGEKGLESRDTGKVESVAHHDEVDEREWESSENGVHGELGLSVLETGSGKSLEEDV